MCAKVNSEEYVFYPAVDAHGRNCFICFSDDELAANPELATSWDAREEWMKRAVQNPDNAHEFKIPPEGA
jgi:hypothetical protein